MISVIIPVYNMQLYLKDCIDSVINQTYRDLEIICVNDGSTDNSLEILNRYTQYDKRIKIISKDNGGLSSARNCGMNAASGEYIAFIDSDDFIAPDYYEKLYSCAVETDADIVASSVYNYYNENTIKRSEWVNFYTMLFQPKRLLVSPKEKQCVIYACACWNKLYKASLLKDIRFSNIYIEDVPFTFECVVKSNKIALVDNAILYYRQRADSIIKTICHTKRLFDIFDAYKVCDNVLQHRIPLRKFERKEYNKILDNFKIFNLRAYFERTPLENRPQFYARMHEVLKKINPKDNPYISKDNLNFLFSVCKNKACSINYKKSPIYIFIRSIQKNIFDIKYHKKANKIHIKIFGIKIYSKN